MAINPMQRKSRNSFLLGVIVTLLIAAIIIAFMFLQLSKKDKELKEEIGTKTAVYTLNQDVKSGQVLTADMFSIQNVKTTTIPGNATSLAGVIDTWFLQTKAGENVQTDAEGLYLNGSDSLIELTKEGNTYYRTNSSGEKVKVTNNTEPIEFDRKYFMVSSDDEITRVYQETTESYYKYKVNDARTGIEKEYLEINYVPVLAKVDMKKNTVITPTLVVKSDEPVTDDLRKEEFNMIVLPLDLMTDDYVDVRLMLPNGQNFIVISKAQVTVPKNDDGTYVADTIFMNLREDEILSISSAIVEAYGIQGAKLYATRYVEPGIQEASTPTYTPNAETTALINSNPNIVAQAREELAARYSENAKNIRNQYIQSQVNGEDSYSSNVQSGMEEGINNSQSVRKQYLESLGY
mgnify:FL=1